MNKYLIFRTDRIGDFLVSAVLIKSIKDSDANSHITLIASPKNYNYIKNFKLVDKVLLLKPNFINKISIIFKLCKESFNTIILHDNKKRSHFISSFIKKKIKISINDIKDKTHLEILKEVLKKLNLSLSENHLDIFEDREIYKFNYSNFVQFHFDEKWIYSKYISSFVNIEPNANELANFIDLIQKKVNKKVIITTGKNAPSILEESIKLCKNENLIYLKDLSFEKLENVVLNSDLLISCHGAISHVASAKKIKQIDIIDSSYPYSKWTKHFRNYNFVYRVSFQNLTKNILNLL